MTKKQEKAIAQIENILEDAYEKISEIAESELGYEMDYDLCEGLIDVVDSDIEINTGLEFR